MNNRDFNNVVGQAWPPSVYIRSYQPWLYPSSSSLQPPSTKSMVYSKDDDDVTLSGEVEKMYGPSDKRFDCYDPVYKRKPVVSYSRYLVLAAALIYGPVKIPDAIKHLPIRVVLQFVIIEALPTITIC
jgi:hypothetical protein